MSNKQAKLNENNNINNRNSVLQLNGDKISLEARPASKASTASSRCSMLAKCCSRPVSAVPLLTLKDDVDDGYKKRPFSAGDSLPGLDSGSDNALTSTALLQNLLSEPIKSWRNYRSEEMDAGSLTPGIATKPPLPVAKKPALKDTDPGVNAIHDYLTLKFDGKIGAEGSSDDSAVNSIRLEEIADEKVQETGNQTLHIQNWIEEDAKMKEEPDEWENKTPNLSEMDIDELFKDESDKKFDYFFRKNIDERKKAKNAKAQQHRVTFTATPIKSGRDYKYEEEDKEKVETWIGAGKQQQPEKATFLDILSDFNEFENETAKNSCDDISQDIPQHDIADNTSSLDDIAGLLEALEAEDKKSQMKIESIKQIVDSEIVTENKEEASSSNYSELLSFLDEVDRSYSKLSPTTTTIKTNNLNLETVPKLEDLVTHRNEELARAVIDLTLRLKDKSSSIQLLQTELSSLRSQILAQTKKTDQTIKEKLNAQKSECEATVKRHQKFIDQLISDKKSLNQQCESLLREMKSLEERFQSNTKALEHKHQVELHKAKEMHLAGEKLRRERWIDSKTQKIKELTVKSIEPELNSMEKRQQQELADLRSLHKREIEDLELRAARKTQEQLEALRNQMVEERERVLCHERDVVRERYEKMVAAEEKSLQEQRKRLAADHAARLAACEDREAAAQSEKERGVKQAQQEFEDRLQIVIRRHANEIKLIRETARLEMEALLVNFKKQQSAEFESKEAAMRERCKRERDREIELVIERLEGEASETKAQLEEVTENRVRRLREKYEKEIGDLEECEREAKSKYVEMKKAFGRLEEEALGLKTTIQHLENQLESVRGVKERLESERNATREIVKNEVKKEIEEMERELVAVKDSRDKELAQLYSRVKVSVGRKDEILEELRRDHRALQEKCSYLESMLEQQRKEYFMK